MWLFVSYENYKWNAGIKSYSLLFRHSSITRCSRSKTAAFVSLFFALLSANYIFIVFSVRHPRKVQNDAGRLPPPLNELRWVDCVTVLHHSITKRPVIDAQKTFCAWREILSFLLKRIKRFEINYTNYRTSVLKIPRN